MSDLKISIIIPVYNVEKYLRKCLDSCINQTLKDIEIICVDDCSTDDSYKILEEYQQKDRRIKVLRQEKNNRQGVARNKGLEIATGEYIWFVDSDDYIDTKACQILYGAIKEFDVEMLCFSALRFSETDGFCHFSYDRYYHQGVQINKIYHPQTNWMEINFSNLNVAPWAYLTKRIFIQKFRFREGVFFEDTDFTTILLSSVNSFCFIPYTAYFYRTNPESTMQTPITPQRLKYVIMCMESLENFIIESKINKKHFLYKFLASQIDWNLKFYGANTNIPAENLEPLSLLQKKYCSSWRLIRKKLKKLLHE